MQLFISIRDQITQWTKGVSATDVTTSLSGGFHYLENCWRTVLGFGFWVVFSEFGVCGGGFLLHKSTCRFPLRFSEHARGSSDIIDGFLVSHLYRILLCVVPTTSQEISDNLRFRSCSTTVCRVRSNEVFFRRA